MYFLSAEAFATLSIFEKCGTMFLYFTIALIVLLGIIGLIIRFKKKENSDIFNHYAVGISIGYSIAIIGIMLFLKFDEIISGEEFFGEIFWPIFALLILLIVLLIVGLIVSMIKKDFLKKYIIISIVLASIYVLTFSIIKLVKIYSLNFVAIKELPLIFSTILIIVIVAFLLIIFGKKEKSENHTKSIVYAAICIATSFALSYIRFFKLPQGGSVTFVSILPLMIYSYVFGIRKGVLSGFIYGLLQAIQDPYILHPIQFLLDYPIAFAMIGLAGIFKAIKLFEDKPYLQLILGGIFCSIMRYSCHVITGIIVFDIYAPEQFSAVAWGFLYNLFVFVDAAIAITAGALLMLSNNFRKELDKIKV